jgi:hypothetical protein
MVSVRGDFLVGDSSADAIEAFLLDLRAEVVVESARSSVAFDVQKKSCMFNGSRVSFVHLVFDEVFQNPSVDVLFGTNV